MREGKEQRGMQPCTVLDFVLSTRPSQENKSELKTCPGNAQQCEGT